MSDCFHCGLPVPPKAHWPVTVWNEARAMCCPGCAAAAQAIVDFGLDSYYRERSALPGRADAAGLIPPELRLFDAQENQQRYVETPATDQSEVTLSIEGLRCTACTWLIERRLVRQPGVLAAQMNLSTERLLLTWDNTRCKLSDILQAVRSIGYVAYPCDPKRQSAALQRTAKGLQRRLFVAILAMMQVMMYAVPAYIADSGTLEADMAGLMRWASLFLTLPAVLYSAQPFFIGAWNNLKNRALGMDVPVALGISAAFIGSLGPTFYGSGDVYYDSVTMFIFLLLCSRYVELLARRKAAAGLEQLQHSLPAAANRLSDYPASRAAEIISPSLLRVGDIVQVKPGETLPADGVIIEGATAVDLSLLTGESQPQNKGVGDVLPGGAINARQAILVRVEKTAQDSTLSVLLQLIERAGLSKPRLALWADQVAGWFVLALLLLAVAVFAFWHFHEPARAWPIAIALLVVSCPCALSLATPTALAAATDRLLGRGVLIVKGHALETLLRASHIIFDKTGTLTLGRPVLQQVDLLGSMTHADCLRYAAALEAGNAHPLAAALVNAAAAQVVAEAQQIVYHSGQGVSGRLDGSMVRIGNADFVGELSGALPAHLPPARPGFTPVYLGSEAGWLARFELQDGLREDAAQIVAGCQALGKNVILLSGDFDGVVQQMAAHLNISTAHGDYLPEQKLAFVHALQAEGAVVAMIGDGINDAAVLSAADVSFAMGSGAALAQAHADGILLGRNLSGFAEALRVSGQCMRVIRQNLAWASLYNMLAIPAAAFGLINPWVSSVGMSLSSIVVVLNAWRLRRGGSR